MTNKALRFSIAFAMVVGASACGDDSAGAGGTDTDTLPTGDTSNPDDDDNADTDDEGSSGGDETGADETGGDTDDPPITDCEQATFDNVIDEAMCPHVQGEGIQPEPADQVEVCRRLYIELRKSLSALRRQIPLDRLAQKRRKAA